ncbi:MAG: glycoside hydrolase family 127 protein [Chloroflexi bacterium]|nr:glycoside hydrolase family 127 protein [Chloroflexota bacterium]
MAVTVSTGAMVVDTASSPFAQLRPVGLDAVTIDDAFWAPRLRTNREATLPSQYRLLWETGRIDNLLRAAGTRDGEFQGRYFNDSDVYKWLEAASWSVAGGHDAEPELHAMIDETISAVEAAQRPDGYLNSYFARERADQRWTDFDLHEMYCAGHLFQAAVAHHRATRSTRLLDVATRFADHIDVTFGPEVGKRIGTDGHPEIEMALVELARETGERRYIDLARFLVDVRGHGVLGDAYGRFGKEYHQDHRPFRDLDEIVGHAVRAVYLNAGVADLYAETGEPALLETLHRLWQSMTTRKMYVSGGIGSRYEGESFGEDYELPNALAYTETCAAIGSMMWNWRMLSIEAEARYADLLELTLYNAMLPGVSLDGETYFYQNPLADEGSHRRQAWFGTACCPPNVARTLASLPGYVYSASDEGIWIHLYAAGTARIPLDDRVVALRQETRYPWDGEITIEVDGEGDFSLMLRIPAWCEEGATLTVNDEPLPESLVPGRYAEVRREWRPGDTVRLSLPMPVRRVESHPYVEENTGRVALMRGPLLYCLEQIDNPAVAIRDIAVPDDVSFQADWRHDLLGGVVALIADARLAPPDDSWSDALYRAARSTPQAAGERVAITAIPYHAWANREPGAMRVWLRRGR